MVSLKDKLRLLLLKCGTGIFMFSMPGMLTSPWGLATKEPVLLLGGGTLVLAGIVINAGVGTSDHESRSSERA